MKELHRELKDFCISKGLPEREAAYLLGLFSKHIQALSQPSVSRSVCKKCEKNLPMENSDTCQWCALADM